MIVCTQQKWFTRGHTLPCDVPGPRHRTIWERCPFPLCKCWESKPEAITRPHTVSGLCCADTTWVNPVITSSWKVPKLSAQPYKDTAADWFTPSLPAWRDWNISKPLGPPSLSSYRTLFYLPLIKLLIQVGPICHTPVEQEWLNPFDVKKCSGHCWSSHSKATWAQGLFRLFLLQRRGNRWIGMRHNVDNVNMDMRDIRFR